MSETVWTRGVECVSTEVEDALVLLDLEGGTYFTLNRSAADVWQALAEPRTVQGIVDILIAKYAVPPEHCAQSVARLLADLTEKGLTKRAG